MKNTKIFLLCSALVLSLNSCTTTNQQANVSPSNSPSALPSISPSANPVSSIKTKAEMIKLTECSYDKTTNEAVKTQIKFILDGMKNYPESTFTETSNANRIQNLKNLNANLEGCM